MRIVYLGTSEFAAAVLRRLAASDDEVELVVTPPDRPRGRGRQVGSPPAAEAARELGIELHQTASINDPGSVERVRATGADLAVVCAFGQLIGEPLLSELEMLNVHPSLLPRWRGAAPIERALMASDAETGVSVMRVTAGLDSGPIALQEATPIAPDEDYAGLSARLAELGSDLLCRALELRAAGGLELRDQDESLATYAEKIEPADRRLDPRRPAPELAARVRALNPHHVAYLDLEGGDRLLVCVASAHGADAPVAELSQEAGQLMLGCTPGRLRLEVVQAPGGRPMSSADYLRGHAPPRLAPIGGAGE